MATKEPKLNYVCIRMTEEQESDTVTLFKAIHAEMVSKRVPKLTINKFLKEYYDLRESAGIEAVMPFFRSWVRL